MGALKTFRWGGLRQTSVEGDVLRVKEVDVAEGGVSVQLAYWKSILEAIVEELIAGMTRNC